VNKNQQGFTAVELLIVVAGVTVVGIVVGILVIVVHFISKFW